MKKFFLVSLLISFGLSLASAYPLSAEQKARLEKYIPKTFAKLQKRQYVHIVALGDSITNIYAFDDSTGTPLNSFYGVFAKQLEREFFYTGGVRDVRPRADMPGKFEAHRGPELSIENIGSGGRMMLHAIQRMTTDAFDNKPDLILIKFGVNDSTQNLSPEEYRSALSRALSLAKKQGVEVILLAPTLKLNDPLRSNLGATRVYAQTMKKVAQEEGVCFVDFGVALSRTEGVPQSKDPAESFARYITQVRRQFERPFADPPAEDKKNAPLDFIHPNELAHRMLGETLFDQLLNGAPELEPLSIEAEMNLVGEDAEVSVTIANHSDSIQRGVLVPLDAQRIFSPDSEGVDFLLRAGKKKEWKFSLKRQEASYPFHPYLCDQGAEICTSFALIREDGARIVDCLIPIRPLYVQWEDKVAHDLQGVLPISFAIVNTSNDTLRGNYVLRWDGQKFSGKLNLKQGEKGEFSHEIALPDSKDERRVILQPLTIEIETAAGGQYHFAQRLEISRQIGLDEQLPLVGNQLLVEKGSDVAARSEQKESASLIFRPRDRDLQVDFRASGVDWEEVVNVYNAEIDREQVGELFFFFDARPGKGTDRTAVGALEAIVFFLVKDGTIISRKFHKPGMLSEGYRHKLDFGAIKGSWKKTEKGDFTAQVYLSQPALFYLHEWEMGSSQSRLGINVAMKLNQQRDLNNPYPMFFKLTENGYNEWNTQSLVPLELTTEPSRRWSARFH